MEKVCNRAETTQNTGGCFGETVSRRSIRPEYILSSTKYGHEKPTGVGTGSVGEHIQADECRRNITGVYYLYEPAWQGRFLPIPHMYNLRPPAAGLNGVTMATRIEANKAIKNEMKSFEACVSLLVSMASLPEVKDYLSERAITKEWLTRKENKALACKAELLAYCKLHEFTAANGQTYKAIFRKDKSGQVVEAKWSIWRVLCAIDARHKALKAQADKAAAIKAQAAKEKSIREIERAEKKPGKAAAIKAAGKRTRKAA